MAPPTRVGRPPPEGIADPPEAGEETAEAEKPADGESRTEPPHPSAARFRHGSVDQQASTGNVMHRTGKMKNGGIASAESAPAAKAIPRRRQPQDRMTAFARRSMGCADSLCRSRFELLLTRCARRNQGRGQRRESPRLLQRRPAIAGRYDDGRAECRSAPARLLRCGARAARGAIFCFHSARLLHHHLAEAILEARRSSPLR